ncbi:MAG: transcriptional repressor [Acidocella sp. 20-57-95]|nr:MAG: transcriptional repressor [Acidocella sp. 20-57-95]HQT64401.1 Fur family transcriptional regulator [Acidocella sp.]HQU04872.1 Fur family transcriptional regulator [Acidocella sp.]
MGKRQPRSIDEQIQDAAKICVVNGTQLTELRRIVLKLVLESQAPLTAYQLLDQLKVLRRNATPPTIYRALDFLLENRLIHKVERINAFIPCSDSDHEHHSVQFLICQTCKTVVEIEDHHIIDALTRAAEKQGFRPRHAVVEIDGICAACSGANK